MSRNVGVIFFSQFEWSGSALKLRSARMKVRFVPDRSDGGYISRWPIAVLKDDF